MLQKSFRTPDEDFADKQICYERNKKHWDEIQSSFPEEIQGCTLSMDDIGQTVIRGFIGCPENFSEEDTRKAMNWLKTFNGKIEKNFRESEGTFYWISRNERTDANGKYDYLIFVEKVHPLNCEIKKVKKEVEVYESVCK